LNSRRVFSLLVSAIVTAAALWSYAAQPRQAPPVIVTLQDGKTIDFSDGTPAVKDSAADKAAMDSAVKEIDAANKDVSFPADPPAKK
jgi:hypothetical protein